MPVHRSSKSPTPALQVPSFSESQPLHVRKPIHSEKCIGRMSSPQFNDSGIEDGDGAIFRPAPITEFLSAQHEISSVQGEAMGDPDTNVLPPLNSSSWDSVTAEMERLWRDGTWRKPSSKFLQEPARLRVVSSFTEPTQRRDANNLLDKIARQHIEAKINAHILNEKFDRSAWISLRAAQHATEMLEGDVQQFMATKVLPEQRTQETTEEVMHSRIPDCSAQSPSLRESRAHSGTGNLSRLKRGIRLDVVSAAGLPCEDDRRIHCRIRLLCVGQQPIELHTYSGKMRRGELQINRRTPFDIFVPEPDFEDAELEHTLWDVSAGEEVFLGGCALKADQVKMPEEPSQAQDSSHLSVLLVDYAPDYRHKIRLMVEHSIKAGPKILDVVVGTPSYTPHPWASREPVFRPSHSSSHASLRGMVGMTWSAGDAMHALPAAWASAY
jgi:hypothetical protein